MSKSASAAGPEMVVDISYYYRMIGRRRDEHQGMLPLSNLVRINTPPQSVGQETGTCGRDDGANTEASLLAVIGSCEVIVVAPGRCRIVWTHSHFSQLSRSSSIAQLQY